MIGVPKIRPNQLDLFEPTFADKYPALAEQLARFRIWDRQVKREMAFEKDMEMIRKLHVKKLVFALGRGLK